MTKRNRQAVQDRRNEKKSNKERQEVQPQKFQEKRKASVIPLTAQNENQKITLKAFTQKQLVGQFGSAGVGKTELMCWWAAKQWLEGNIDNIVITRPHQHLGNDYGAVKGNDAEKLLPFCMSMLNKLKKYLGVGILRNNFKLDGFDDLFADASGIQIVPVEKIQGLSYNDRTIILADEVQNMTIAQVKALATRPEEGCQLLLAGDNTQSALNCKNGLTYLEDCLLRDPHEDAEIIHYNPEDNCRKGIAGHLTRVFEKQGQW